MPRISVIMATRDRPDFVPVALECYRRQRYAHRELIVLDHGERCPVDPAAVADVGGVLERVDPVLTLGDALNAGVRRSTGLLGCVVDDDDWYGPGFLEMWVARAIGEWRDTTTSLLVLADPFLIFDVAAWQVRVSTPGRASGSAIGFLRSDAIDTPFRPRTVAVDSAFFFDLWTRGVPELRVPRPESYLAVRHGGPGRNRGHTWLHSRDTRTVEAALVDRPLYKAPEALIDEWALPFYRGLHEQLAVSRPG